MKTNKCKHAFVTTEDEHIKLKAGLVTFYDHCPGNGMGPLSKNKISKEVNK